MTCQKCGAELTEGAKFCGSCGANQEMPDVTDAAVHEAEPTTCKKCGAELPAGAKFCSACGTNQDAPDAAAGVSHAFESGKAALQNLSGKAAQNPLLSEGTAYWRGFFSHDPTSELTHASESKSLFWILALAINTVLFSLAVCINIPQLLNQGWDSLVHSVIQTLKDTIPGGKSFFFGAEEQIPSLDMPPLFSLFIPFILISLALFAVEVVGVYVPMLLLKSKPESVSALLNTLCTSLFPITVVSLLNLLLGLIWPPLTICTLVAAVFIHILLLYEGIKVTVKASVSPIWQIGLTVFVIGIIFIAVMGLIFASALEDAVSAMANGVMNEAASIFGNMLGGMFG